MALFCNRSKTKDDLKQNNELKKRIDQSTSDNIDLSSMDLTDEDIPMIMKKIIKKRKATSLTLTSNKITADGIRILVNSLKKNKNFTHLILSSNPIGDEGIKYLIELIENNRNLYHLSLSDTNITDHGIELLTNLLRLNSTSLRCLDLRSNQLITDLSIDFFLEIVENNQILSACRLDNCGLSQQGKEKLREAKSIRW